MKDIQAAAGSVGGKGLSIGQMGSKNVGIMKHALQDF
jgi:hypothetical protein